MKSSLHREEKENSSKYLPWLDVQTRMKAICDNQNYNPLECLTRMMSIQSYSEQQLT